jgi:hypothetical protein
MSNHPDLSASDQQSTGAGPSRPSPRASFWLRELPYAAVLFLTILGIAYTSYSKQSIVAYWEFLAPVIALVCVGSGWRHAHDKEARLRLIWTQALHWFAFLVAMNLVLLPGVQRIMNANASGLAILMLLALGTFTAGVHILVWQVCLVGIVMALGVPAIAWMEQSALLLLLGTVALLGIGLAFWWGEARLQGRASGKCRLMFCKLGRSLRGGVAAYNEAASVGGLIMLEGVLSYLWKSRCRPVVNRRAGIPATPALPCLALCVWTCAVAGRF